MEPEFLELMPLTCTLTPIGASTGIAGERSYGTAVTPHCHVEYKVATHVDPMGNTITQEGSIFLDGVYAVRPTWKLVIPVPGGTREVKIVGIDQNTDEVDFHHTVVRFGAI